jgi:hypothetical protein
VLSYRSVGRYLDKLQLSINNNESINPNSNNNVTSNVAIAAAVIQDTNPRQGCIIV